MIFHEDLSDLSTCEFYHKKIKFSSFIHFHISEMVRVLRWQQKLKCSVWKVHAFLSTNLDILADIQFSDMHCCLCDRPFAAASSNFPR